VFISFAVLSDLTDQHLKEIGVSLGHRLQLLRAIAELTGKDAPKAASAPVSSEATIQIVAKSFEPTGERRHVTVMFCDLADSTGIAAKLDAEDV
jgi:class 3 adenylate cyclase